VEGLPATIKLAVANKLSAAELFNNFVCLYTKMFLLLLLLLLHMGCPLVIDVNR